MSKLAIAYAMKKKAQKMADGGPVLPQADTVQASMRKAFGKHAEGGEICPSCGAAPMSDGGQVKGVHKPYFDEPETKQQMGESKAGDKARHLDVNKKVKHEAKEEHHKVLGELHSMKNPNLKGLADGGMAEDDGDDMVSRIMAKKMSKGGQVANDTHPFEYEFETPNEFDDLVLDDNLESHYGDDDNSGDMLGNKAEDHDRSDIISRIMASRKKKDKNPRPA